jgi:fatty acid desaturase
MLPLPLRHRYKIHDKIYDLSNFVKIHPGGQDMFNHLKPDTNITPMIYAYHKNPKGILAMLPKYEVPLTDLIKIEYDTNYTYESYCELKKLVYDEIREKKIPLYWSNQEIAYNAFMLSFYLGMLIYFYLNSNTITFGYIFLLSIIRAGSPGAMFHETAHYIGFKNQKINKWLSDYLLLDIFIANEWRIRHNYIHHSFTNTNYDEDLHKAKIVMRYSFTHKLLFNHMFQHNVVYLSLLFCLNAIVKASYKKIVWGDWKGFIFNCISLYIIGYKYIVFFVYFCYTILIYITIITYSSGMYPNK